jgi:hypothetical protein
MHTVLLAPFDELQVAPDAVAAHDFMQAQRLRHSIRTRIQ